MELEYLLINSNNKAIKAAYWEYINLGEVKTEAETKTTTERGSVNGIITPLDTESITLQDGRSNT